MKEYDCEAYEVGCTQNMMIFFLFNTQGGGGECIEQGAIKGGDTRDQEETMHLHILLLLFMCAQRNV